VHDNLIERDFGIMTGKAVDQIEALCAPDIIKADIITYFLSPEGAETFPELIQRGQKVLDYIRSQHTSGNILLVCHGDLGKMIYCAATGKNWRDVLVDFHFGNGELIDISGIGEAHRVKLAQHNH
jgi:probable phosphoglycerate mutase